MLPIKYPDNFPDVLSLKGRAHDLSQRLFNPNPKSDWKPGDIAWVYDQNEQAIVPGIISSVREDYAFVRDIQPDRHITEVGAWLTELFPSSDDLYKALFDTTDSDKTTED